MRYVGGKNHAGTYQRIINLIPPHRVYIEACAGSGAVLRHLLPARKSIAIDKDASVLPALEGAAPNLTLLQADAIEWLGSYAWRGDEFVYLDPPYLLSTRGGRKYYRHEMSDDDHRRLLGVIVKIPAAVMISGYRSAMYDEALAKWRREEFSAYTRNHRHRVECVWMNYPRPQRLHDTRYVGTDYRDRWRLQKKKRRWRERFAAMDHLEREAMFAVLREVMGHGGEG